VRDILEVARWAPSGGNLQAWRVVAVAGEERDAVVRLAAQSGATYSSETQTTARLSTEPVGALPDAALPAG